MRRYPRTIEQPPPFAVADATAGSPELSVGPAASRIERMRQRGRERRTRAGRTNIKSIRYLRALAVLEATAFLVLIVCGFTHPHLWGIDLLFVMGNVHGAVFTAYLISIFVFRNKVGWGPVMLLAVLVAGLIPGGGIMVERWALHPPR